MKKKHCEVILYPEDGWTVDSIISTIQIYTSIKLYAFILHDRDVDEHGNLKPSHFHLYLNFGNSPIDFEYVAKWFRCTTNKVNKIEHSRKAMLAYMLHANCADKAAYMIDEVTANFDVASEIAGKFDDKKILEDCANGIITRDNYTAHVSSQQYIALEKKMQTVWEWYEHAYTKQNRVKRECTTIWIHGNSGTGKTTLASMLADYMGESVYITATGKDPFSHYTGQAVVILDDIRAGLPFSFSELLKIIDPHFLSPVGSRYHDKILCCKVIMICTVQSPKQFFNSYQLSDEDSYRQLIRRLSYILEISADKIHIYGDYKDESHRYLASIPNPIPAYLRKLENDKTNEPINLMTALSELSNQYVEPQIQQLYFDDRDKFDSK